MVLQFPGGGSKLERVATRNGDTIMRKGKIKPKAKVRKGKVALVIGS